VAGRGLATPCILAGEPLLIQAIFKVDKKEPEITESAV
jgi:hypothetical protein